MVSAQIVSSMTSITVHQSGLLNIRNEKKKKLSGWKYIWGPSTFKVRLDPQKVLSPPWRHNKNDEEERKGGREVRRKEGRKDAST